MTDLPDRLLNPAIIATMIGAGLAYAWFLWSLDIRPAIRLYGAAIIPGAIFLCVIWVARTMQGVASCVWPVLLIDWLIFANTGFLGVLGARRIRRMRDRP